ncbi:T6SS immunity protein Tdi1 domain-containing protein [Acaryochloris marina]|uniref:T6SS immunity protein Tdi1 C-terminal domain-containing protein n=1 Tax=Acaryochloris marina (strain MBIC 11017) TaxID=329726 RepID=B0CBL5_ACAM1|nr:T6SS immunity protein Tdi1 domain-containing protein [Acaryochloris marina]ABW29133.1 hypothetical protein AM1_4152 [Acaryochloris marina MBIC11017]
MDLLVTVQKSWSWCGIQAAKIVAQNDFGNLIVLDDVGTYWRICPEDLYCEIIATNAEEMDELSNDEEFRTDWEMSTLIEIGQELYGKLPPEHCYCLKVPSIWGGAYSRDNIDTMTRAEVIAYSGDLAEQIKDLPDGANIKLTVTD